jgi:uncharacterized protein involved in exopolysaccharide biosynthesis
VSIKTEPRLYLISVSYSDTDPEFAAIMTNAFVTEALRSAALQMLWAQRDMAQVALTHLLATFGERHPKVAEARLLVETMDARVQEMVGKSPEEIRQNAGEYVSFAQVVRVPTSPDPVLFVGIALLAGLIVGVYLAIRVDRGSVPNKGKLSEVGGVPVWANAVSSKK